VIPAVCNVSLVVGKSYLRRLSDTQLRAIAGFAASLAGLQILGEIRGLSKPENWAKAKTGHWRQKIFPETTFHIVRPSQEVKTSPS
jgi:hypothetical protein